MDYTPRTIAHLLLVVMVLGLAGCTATVRPLPNGGGVVIEVGGLGQNPGPGLGGPTEPTPTTGGETSATLPQPGTNTTPPAGPQAPQTTQPGGTTQPSGAATADVKALTTQQCIDELKNKYGITVSGNYTTVAAQKTLLSARQLLPEDLKSLKINFSDRNAGGVMGMWTSSGQITIYLPARESITTVFHEMVHHATLFRTSTHGRGVAEEVVTAVGAGRNPKQFPANVITRSYAQTNIAEFWAELFSVYRIKKEALWGSSGFTGSFNPPESLRPTIEKMYAPKTGNS